MGDFRITITIAEHGFDSAAAERCIDSLDRLYAEVGPVVTQNVADGTMAITIAVTAADAWEAGKAAARIYAAALDDAQLRVTPVIDVHTTAVDPEREPGKPETRELTPA
jgi:methenyltetrahydromethanopterin cyclohydrolase